VTKPGGIGKLNIYQHAEAFSDRWWGQLPQRCGKPCNPRLPAGFAVKLPESQSHSAVVAAAVRRPRLHWLPPHSGKRNALRNGAAFQRRPEACRFPCL